MLTPHARLFLLLCLTRSFSVVSRSMSGHTTAMILMFLSIARALATQKILCSLIIAAFQGAVMLFYEPLCKRAFGNDGGRFAFPGFQLSVELSLAVLFLGTRVTEPMFWFLAFMQNGCEFQCAHTSFVSCNFMNEPRGIARQTRCSETLGSKMSFNASCAHCAAKRARKIRRRKSTKPETT